MFVLSRFMSRGFAALHRWCEQVEPPGQDLSLATGNRTPQRHKNFSPRIAPRHTPLFHPRYPGLSVLATKSGFQLHSSDAFSTFDHCSRTERRSGVGLVRGRLVGRDNPGALLARNAYRHIAPQPSGSSFIGESTPAKDIGIITRRKVSQRRQPQAVAALLISRRSSFRPWSSPLPMEFFSACSASSRSRIA